MAVFHDEVEIEDFEYDEETETYFYPCPCGDQFQITKVGRTDFNPSRQIRVSELFWRSMQADAQCDS